MKVAVGVLAGAALFVSVASDACGSFLKNRAMRAFRTATCTESETTFHCEFTVNSWWFSVS
jgi:hypothetical protein